LADHNNPQNTKRGHQNLNVGFRTSSLGVSRVNNVAIFQKKKKKKTGVWSTE